MTDYDAVLAEMPESDGRDPLEASGLAALPIGCDLGDLATALRRLTALANGTDALGKLELRGRVLALLKLKQVNAPARWVDAALPTADAATSTAGQGQAVAFADPEPWPDPVTGDELLEDLCAFVARYVASSRDVHRVLATFVLASHAADAFDAVPYLALESPTPECGKTRVLEVLELLVRRPWFTMLPSPPVLFRVLEQYHPCLLLDEAQVVKGRGESADAIRALFLGGYKRGALVPRCIGEHHEVRHFDVFGLKVFALIGALPNALGTRCIRIAMRRRHMKEPLEPLRRKRIQPEAEALSRRARRWADDHREALAAMELEPPDFLSDRLQETWEPLLDVAALAGGEWYDQLVDAAAVLRRQSRESNAALLLADVRDLFTAREVDRLPTSEILEHLHALETRPWPEWGKQRKPITPRGLAALLEDFDVTPTTIRLGERTAKGYTADSFADAWARWLDADAEHPPSYPSQRNIVGRMQDCGESYPSHEGVAVTDRKSRNPSQNADCYGVTDRTGASSQERPFLDPDEAARTATREGA